jgi:hypothetical protein
MASPVSYTRAVQVAVLAVAADLYWNQGCTVSSIALGYLGYLGTVAIEAYKQRSQDISFQHSAYRRQSRPDIDEPVRQKESLKKALARVQKDYSALFEEYIKSKKLSSPEEVLDFFIKELEQGCCAGVVDTLFEKIILKESRSLQESATLLDSESMFYYQILQMLYVVSKASLELSDNYALQDMLKERNDMFKEWIECYENYTLPLKELPKELLDRDSAEWDREIEKRTAQYKEKFAKHLKDLGRNIHQSTFQDSEEFPVAALPKMYKENLAKATLTFPESQDFVGVIHTPKHVFAFQYGPKGYFIFDTVDSSKGLFRYPNREIFFQQLQREVLYDVQIYAKEYEALPIGLATKFTPKSEEQVNKYKTYFSIRPLENINPAFSKG